MGRAQAFLDATPEQVQEVVATNLTGSLLCTKRAMQLMASQKTRGHIFNMDGAGADLAPTPRYAAYGATKAGEVAALLTAADAGSKVNACSCGHPGSGHDSPGASGGFCVPSCSPGA